MYGISMQYPFVSHTNNILTALLSFPARPLANRISKSRYQSHNPRELNDEKLSAAKHIIGSTKQPQTAMVLHRTKLTNIVQKCNAEKSRMQTATSITWVGLTLLSPSTDFWDSNLTSACSGELLEDEWSGGLPDGRPLPESQSRMFSQWYQVLLLNQSPLYYQLLIL